MKKNLLILSSLLFIGFTVAAQCIVENQRDQDSIFAILNRSGIANSSTTAPDGGRAAYAWLGGNDKAAEGTWIWDSYAGGTGQFWLGARTGSVVGLYN